MEPSFVLLGCQLIRFQVSPLSTVRQSERSYPTAYAVFFLCGDQTTGPNIAFERSVIFQVAPPSRERAMPVVVARMRRAFRGSTATPMAMPLATCVQLRPFWLR